MNKIKAIIFDFDDTLVASGKSIMETFVKTGEDLGLEMPPTDEIMKVLGLPLVKLLPALWPDVDINKASTLFLQHYESVLVPQITNANQILHSLKEQGYHLYIVTGNINVRKHLVKAGFSDDLFMGIFTPHDLPYHKPNAKVFDHFLEKYHRDELLYVGDSMTDAEASLGAGIPFIGVLTGYCKREDLEGIGATQVLPSVQELPLLFENDKVPLPTEFGEFKIESFMVNGKEHIVLSKGNVKGENILTRIHSECSTSEIFGSLRCDCRQQLHASLRLIEKEGVGMVIYLKQEGRGIGLSNKLKAYKLQDSGLDTVEANHTLGFNADLRTYEDAVSILKENGISSIRLLTNNPTKVKGVEEGEIMVTRVSLEVPVNHHNTSYMDTKKEKMGHL